MSVFKDLISRVSFFSIIVPLLAGFIGGIGSYYIVPQINQIITKYVFVDKNSSSRNNSDIFKKSEVNGATDNQIQSNVEELSITQIVDKVSPSVVSVVVSKEISRMPINPFGDMFSFGLPFNIVLPDTQQGQPSKEKQQVGGGTGFIISSNGYILTNKHVVADSNATYSVVISSGKKYDAIVIDRDPLNDLAVLKISASNLPSVTLGDSKQIKVGQTVVAIGYALGEYSNSVTRGIVSGLGRDIVAGDGSGASESLQGVIQTDAAINPGNSGGPLINLYGEVIGINTAINSSGQNVGFAIPINSAKLVINSVVQSGRIVRPYLGVRYVLLNSDIAKKNNLSISNGALIVRGSGRDQLAITANSPASKANLKEGDVIISVDNQEVSEKQPLGSLIANCKPGQSVQLKVWRNNKEIKINVTLEEYKN
jgi:serine protease Do